jgi:hypothetical protein
MNYYNFTNNSTKIRNDCCGVTKKDSNSTKCKCKKQIEEKDKLISVLTTKITLLQNKLKKMETFIKYSKSVDMRNNALTESVEFPKKIKEKKKRQVSALNFSEEHYSPEKSIKETITPTHAHYRYYSKMISSQFTTKQSFKDKDNKDSNINTLRTNRSNEKNQKRFSLNLTGYNFNMIKPYIPSKKSRDKVSKSKDYSIKNDMKSSYDHYDRKDSKKNFPNFNTTPINIKDISQNDNTRDYLDRNNHLILNEVNENISSDDEEFSFHNEISSDADIKNQLVFIKTRTQTLMKKLSDANKKLIRRVNSISTMY